MRYRESFRHRRAEQLLIKARCKLIRECCQSHPLDLQLEFYGHSGTDYAGISCGGVKLEINLMSGSWGSDQGESPGPVGVITGTKENFQRVLGKVFPNENMRGA